jgi:hypothetical protein
MLDQNKEAAADLLCLCCSRKNSLKEDKEEDEFHFFRVWRAYC